MVILPAQRLLCCSRMLLASVSKNIFMTIVEHAPYAIEDLMKELEQQGGGEDSDSGQASGEEDEEEEVGEKKKLKNKTPKKTNVKVNGGLLGLFTGLNHSHSKGFCKSEYLLSYHTRVMCHLLILLMSTFSL